MNNDSSQPPSSPLLRSGEETDRAGANAVCKEGSPGSVEADDRNIFARALVHDLRNAIAPIRNAVQLLRFRCSADPDLAGSRAC